MSDDLHSPTSAAPAPPTEPTPVATPGDAGHSGVQQLAAGARQTFDEASEKPEVLVGAAFAGGLVGAIVLKKLTRG